MKPALKPSPSGQVYSLEGSSVWITTGNHEIWIISTDIGLTVSVWDPKTEEPIENIFITEGRAWLTTTSSQ